MQVFASDKSALTEPKATLSTSSDTFPEPMTVTLVITSSEMTPTKIGVVHNETDAEAKCPLAPKKVISVLPQKTSAKASRAKPAKKAAGKLSAINAAAKVLGETKKALNCRELVEAMAAKGYWKSPGGQTPHATLYSAISREIQKKGKDARFKKADRGQFALNR